MDFYFADFTSIGDYENMSFFFGKIPVFVGYRMYNKNMFIMYEAGIEINTELRATDDDFEFLGKIPNSNSYDIVTRLKVGKGNFMMMLGAEFWISEIFENNDYRMMSMSVGMRFSF